MAAQLRQKTEFRRGEVRSVGGLAAARGGPLPTRSVVQPFVERAGSLLPVGGRAQRLARVPV